MQSQNRVRGESSIMKTAGVPEATENPAACLCLFCIPVLDFEVQDLHSPIQGLHVL